MLTSVLIGQYWNFNFLQHSNHNKNSFVSGVYCWIYINCITFDIKDIDVVIKVNLFEIFAKLYMFT